MTSYPLLPILFTSYLLISFSNLISGQSDLCKSSCNGIPINYPFGLSDGCGNPYYRRLLICVFDIDTGGQILELRTPSGRYPVHRINYEPDPHLLITDPSMWTCKDGSSYRRPTIPFTLDTSTHFTLSPHNQYLFFNCSPNTVIVHPRPLFCERNPNLCPSTCDSASYLCRHLPDCGEASAGSVGRGCCSYYPKAAESLRLMLRECTTFTSVYWRNGGGGEVDVYGGGKPEYGVRIDYEIPVSGKCLGCEDKRNGGGVCGFNTTSLEFECLCEKGNVTTYCKDKKGGDSRHHSGNAGAVVGTVSAFSVAGAVGVGAGVWYLKKVRASAPVTHGVQSNENRLF